MSFLYWAKHVLFRPKHFFAVEEKKIKGWRHPITYLIIFTLFATIFTTFQQFSNLQNFTVDIMDTLGINAPVPNFELSLQNYLALFLILSFVAIFGSFFRYWVTHWYIKAYNRHATYKQTYKTLTFSTTPGWIGVPFFMLTSFLSVLAITRGDFIFWFLFIISLLFTLLIESYSVYVRTVAVSMIFNIHWFKAFLSIYVFGLLTYFFLIALLTSLLFLLAIAIVTFSVH